MTYPDEVTNLRARVHELLVERADLQRENAALEAQIEQDANEDWRAWCEKFERENAALRDALIECKDTLVEYVHGDIENPARMNSALNIARAALQKTR
jgi:uncharacterized protein YukE